MAIDVRAMLESSMGDQCPTEDQLQSMVAALTELMEDALHDEYVRGFEDGSGQVY